MWLLLKWAAHLQSAHLHTTHLINKAEEKNCVALPISYAYIHPAWSKQNTLQGRENTEIGHLKFEYFVFKMHKMSNTTTYSIDRPQQLLKIYIPLKQ